MAKLTDEIISKIKAILNDHPTKAPTYPDEHRQAMRYLQYLININELDTLEEALIRFFRIRPSQFNAVESPVSSIYTNLKAAGILTNEPQTPEEEFLSEFLTALFTPTTSPQLTTDDKLIELKPISSFYIYKTVLNVEPGIKELSLDAPTFDWSKTRLRDAVKPKDSALAILQLFAGASEDKWTEYNIDELFNLFIDAISTNRNILASSILSSDLLGKKALLNRPDANGYTPLHAAAKHGNTTMTKMLINQGADLNLKTMGQNTPLSLLAGRYNNQIQPEHIDVAKMLLEKMTAESVNAITQCNKTALWWAVYKENDAIAQLLAQFEGIDLYTSFEEQENILLVAAENEWDDIVEKILSEKDGKKLINSAAGDGWTPLHLAAYNGYVKTTKILIDNGANVDLKNNDGETALAIVAGCDDEEKETGHVEIAKMLLAKMTPESVNATTEDGDRALWRAAENDNREILALLLCFKGINHEGLMSERTPVSKLYRPTVDTSAKKTTGSGSPSYSPK